MIKSIKQNVFLDTFIRVARILPHSYRWKAVLSLFLLLVNSVMDLLGLGAVVPLIVMVLRENSFQENEWLAWLYEHSFATSETEFIYHFSFALLLIIIIKNLASILIQYIQTEYAYSLQKHFSLHLFKAFSDKGLLYFKSTNSTKVMRDVQSVPLAFASRVILPLLSVLNELVIMVLIVIGLYTYDSFVLILLVGIVLPTFLGFFLLTRKKSKFIAKRKHEIQPSLHKNILEMVFGFVDMMITNTKAQFESRHESLQEEFSKRQVQEVVLKYAPPKILETAMFLGVIIIFLYGVTYYDSSERLIELLGIYALAAYRTMPSVNRILIGMVGITGYRYTIDLIEKEIAIFSKSTEADAEVKPLAFSHGIEAKDLVFNYNEQSGNVLDGVSLDIKKGTSVGIIGESGSGKSTFMNILLGFFRPTSGSVLVDGKHIFEDNLISWRSLVGYVQQEVFLVDGTIKENVAFGCDVADIDEEKVVESLKTANLYEFVKGLEHGIHSTIGERGGMLSGGQRQRIAIARALYSGAEILFFDEATSAMDSKTEEEITESIHALQKQNLTLVIIAHRISTLKYCDKIVQFENGKVRDDVTYSELVSKTF